MKLIFRSKALLLSIAVVVVIGILILTARSTTGVNPKSPEESSQPKRVWEFKSIDTMKYSRDLSKEKLNDPSFDSTIEKQMSAIVKTGATHVAIGTPYDEEFLPILKRWVMAARKENLNVWFRGNLSGWEGWFGHKKDLTRESHQEQIVNFVKNNKDLFKDGDMFSPCPECENGGPGDPRHNADLKGFQEFMISEHKSLDSEFKSRGQKVLVLNSMNLDVAKIAMDPATADATGNLIVIDHYVKSPETLNEDINEIAQKAEAKVILGEFGAPIPAIHGKMNEKQQAAWIEDALGFLSKNENLTGLNYWVNVGGSTAIYIDDMSPKLAVNILKKYYEAKNLLTI